VGFLYAFLSLLEDVFDTGTVMVFLFMALLSLLYDGRRYKSQNNVKEYRIIKVMSYFYIVVGIILFALLRMG
jgi:type IV secretory pathway TrbL component